MQLTRRSLLLAAGGLALAACRPKRPARPASVADRAALVSVLDAERTLVAGYDAAIAQQDAVAAGRLGLERDRHAAHIGALQNAMREPTASANAGTATGSALGTMLHESVPTLQAAANAAVDGAVAALFASIAAEHSAAARAAAQTGAAKRRRR